MEKRNGKLIVIEGTDGSGKATQTRLLVYRLKQLGYKVETLSFPQYNTKSAGLIENYLSGKYGSADEVRPHIASLFFATDRYDASFKIKEWLAAGRIVVLDRYTASNMAHQGGKISDRQKRNEFYDWLFQLENNLLQIPKPDIYLILHVEAEIAQKLAKLRKNPDWQGKERDIHEEEINHLRQAEQVYLEISPKLPNSSLIRCTREGKIMSPEYISTMIWQKVKEKIEDDWHLYHSSPEIKKSSNLFTIKKLSNKAHYSELANPHHSGVNLHANDYYTLEPQQKIVIDTEIEVKLPEGIAATLIQNSKNSPIHVLSEKLFPNTQKRLEISLINLSNEQYHISPGEIIAEMLIQKTDTIEFIEEESTPEPNLRIFSF